MRILIRKLELISTAISSRCLPAKACSGVPRIVARAIVREPNGFRLPRSALVRPACGTLGTRRFPPPSIRPGPASPICSQNHSEGTRRFRLPRSALVRPACGALASPDCSQSHFQRNLRIHPLPVSVSRVSKLLLKKLVRTTLCMLFLIRKISPNKPTLAFQ